MIINKLLVNDAEKVFVVDVNRKKEPDTFFGKYPSIYSVCKKGNSPNSFALNIQ